MGVNNAVYNGSSLDFSLPDYVSVKVELQDCPRPMWKEFAKSKSPLSKRKLSKMFDVKGRLLHTFRSFKLAVYQAGVEPEVRPFVWRLLLGVVDPYTTGRRRINQMQSYALQYKAMRDAVVRRFGDTAPNLDDQLRCVANMVRKDVVRTDRTLSYFAGQEDNNKNLIALFYILTTYALTHPDVGYCQGMSDLAAPILYVMRNESEAYVCFCAPMLRMKRYFLSSTNCHIILKFDHMNRLLALYDPLFHKYLNSVHSDPLLFCYRWFLLELKREFQFHDALHLMDVMWASAISLTDLDDSTAPLQTVKLADALRGTERIHVVSSHHADSADIGHITSSNVEEPEKIRSMTAGDQMHQPKLQVFSSDDGPCRPFHSIPLYEVKLAFGSPTTDRLDDTVLALSSPKLYPNGEGRTAIDSTYSRCRNFVADGSAHVPNNIMPSYSELSDVGAVSDCRQTNIHSSTIGQRIPTVNKPQIVPGALSCPDYILSRAVHNYLMEIRGDESDDDYDNYRRYKSYVDDGLNCAGVRQRPSFFKQVNANLVPAVPYSNPIRKRHRSRSCPPKNRSILVHLKNLLADRRTAAKRRAARHNVMSRYSTKSPNFSVLRRRRSSAAVKTSSSRWSLDDFSTTSTSSFDDAMYLNVLSRSLDAPVTDLSDNINAGFRNCLTCSKCSKKRITLDLSNLVDDEAQRRQAVADGYFYRRLAPNFTVDENRDHKKRNFSIINTVISAPTSNSSSRNSRIDEGQLVDQQSLSIVAKGQKLGMMKIKNELGIAFVIVHFTLNLNRLFWNVASLYEYFQKISRVDWSFVRLGFLEGKHDTIKRPANDQTLIVNEQLNCRSSHKKDNSRPLDLNVSENPRMPTNQNSAAYVLTHRQSNWIISQSDRLTPSPTSSVTNDFCRCNVDTEDAGVIDDGRQLSRAASTTAMALRSTSTTTSRSSNFGECACGCDADDDNADRRHSLSPINRQNAFDRFFGAFFTGKKSPQSAAISADHSAERQATTAHRSSSSVLMSTDSFATETAVRDCSGIETTTFLSPDHPESSSASATSTQVVYRGGSGGDDDDDRTPVALAADAAVEHFETLKRRLTLSRIHDLCVSSISATSSSTRWWSKASSGVSSMTSATSRTTTTATTVGGSTNGNVSPQHDVNQEHTLKRENFLQSDESDGFSVTNNKNSENSIFNDRLPPPQILGDGNPFMLFVSLVILMEHGKKIMKENLDYNEIAYYFDKMMRKHDVGKVLKRARVLYADYLKSFEVLPGS